MPLHWMELPDDFMKPSEKSLVKFEDPKDKIKVYMYRIKDIISST